MEKKNYANDVPKNEILQFSNGLLIEFRHNSVQEIKESINISIRMQKILDNRNAGLMPVIFLNELHPKTTLGLKLFQNRTIYSERIPKNFCFPIYDIAMGNTRDNAENNKHNGIHSFSVEYYFNSDGQSIKCTSVSQNTSPLYWALESKKIFEKNKPLPEEHLLYEKLTGYDYDVIREWLGTIEKGKCLESIYNYKPKPQEAKIFLPVK